LLGYVRRDGYVSSTHGAHRKMNGSNYDKITDKAVNAEGQFISRMKQSSISSMVYDWESLHNRELVMRSDKLVKRS
jgi:hypothetical protein